MGIRFSFLKVLLTVAVGLIGSGCTKKDWNCDCTVNGDPYSTVIKNTTKSKAGKACGDYGKRIGSQQGNYVYKCKVN